MPLANRELVKEKETNSIALQFIFNWIVPLEGLVFSFMNEF